MVLGYVFEIGRFRVIIIEFLFYYFNMKIMSSDVNILYYNIFIRLFNVFYFLFSIYRVGGWGWGIVL